MKNIVIIRGPQGSGKSRLVRKLGLEGHHLSFDKVREVVAGDTLNIDGMMTIPQQHNGLVWEMTQQSLKRRMETGETIVFEATLPTAQDIKSIMTLARHHDYAVMIVDFYNTRPHQVLAANLERPERSRVGDHSIMRAYEEGWNTELPKHIPVAYVNDIHDTLSAQVEIAQFLMRDTKPKILSSYRQVVHIGDLQGTLHPLLDPASPLANGIEDDVFYIFCGDLFDRGLENDLVARWWLDNAVGRNNVILIGGNHEDHVENAAAGRPVGSREWIDRTWPQLEAAGITREDLQTITKQIVPMIHYNWGGTEVLVTHGGFTKFPASLHLVPDAILRRGNGHYGTGLDAMWSDSEQARFEADPLARPRFQVHGHRNAKMLPTHAAPYSFNLEAQVEFGGHMRFAILDASGWSTVEVRSTNYRTMQAERAIADRYHRQPYGTEGPITPWAARAEAAGENGLVPLSDEALAAFTNHDMVAIKSAEAMPHVSSVNFTKSAFYSKNWDAYTTVARGLFIDNIDNTIVARSYEKFFNHGERAETSDDALQASLAFPVEGFSKANGFLCITGYSERTGELIIASKSRVDGTFAEWAQTLVAEKLGPAGMERLLRFNRDQKASVIFEAIDMANDPHIIDYPENKLVLLGCVRRHETFEQLDYDQLVKLASWLGCEVKERLFPKVKDWLALSKIMERVETNPDWCKNNPTEGIVFQDANGFQWKSKAHGYRIWKIARSAVERIALCRRKDIPFDQDRYADTPEIAEFIAWAKTLPDEALAAEVGIVALRDMWFNDRAKAEAMGAAPAPKPRNMDGFLKAVDGLAAQVEAGSAKPESIHRFLVSAERDIDKLITLHDLAAAETLRRFAIESGTGYERPIMMIDEISLLTAPYNAEVVRHLTEGNWSEAASNLD
jgi:predicted kinase